MVLGDFRFWCHKVLPLVYDDSLSYYELLCKLVKYTNELSDQVNNVVTDLANLKAYVDEYFDNIDVESIVADKLNEMLENGDFDEYFAEVEAEVKKVETEVRKKVNGVSVPVQYAGDIIQSANYHCSSAFVLNELGYAYLLFSPNRSYAESVPSDNGILYRVDLVNNSVDATYTVKAGHGNSMCYDEDAQKLYIVPVYSYENSSQVSVQHIYSYNLNKTNGVVDTNSLVTISTSGQGTPFGIAFNASSDNSVRGTYYILYPANTTAAYSVYKITNAGSPGTLTYRLHITQKDFPYEQAFACHNNNFYVSNARGKMAVFDVSLSTTADVYPLFVKNIETSDCFNGRRLGEIQDFNVDSEGVVWGASTFNFTSNTSVSVADGVVDGNLIRLAIDGFNEDTLYAPSPYTFFGMTNSTWNINTTTIGHFANGNTELKHPMQVMLFNNKEINNININTTTDFGRLLFIGDVFITVPNNGTFKFGVIYSTCGRLTLYAGGANSTLVVTGDYGFAFKIERGGALTLAGNRFIIDNVGGSDVAINVGIYSPITVIRLLPTLSNGGDVKLADVVIDSAGVYMDANKFSYVT